MRDTRYPLVIRYKHSPHLVGHPVHHLSDLADHLLVGGLEDGVEGGVGGLRLGGAGQLHGLLDLADVKDGGQMLQRAPDLLDVVDGDAQLQMKSKSLHRLKNEQQTLRLKDLDIGKI